MPIKLGARIATLGNRWERITHRSQLSDGDIYYMPSISIAGVAPIGDEEAFLISQTETYRISPP